MRIVVATEGLQFDGDTLSKQSLGGSETAVLCVAKEFAKMGHEITVYNNCENEGMYDGVEYLNINKWRDFVDCGYADIAIVSRFMQMFGQKLNTKLNILWNHDMLPDEMKNILFSLSWNIDYMYCLSEYHKAEYLKQLPELEPIIKLNTNGIDTSLVPKDIKKKHKIMFTSRPERGLYQALDIFEKLGDKTLEFLICNYTTIDNEEVRQIEAMCAKRVNALIEQGYNIRIDSFTKDVLYKEIAESKAVIYPTQFPEISCISAMEAQACGTAYITTHAFALLETVGYSHVIKLGDDYDEKFMDVLSKTLNKDEFRIELEELGLKYVEKYTWENVAKKFIDDAEDHFKARSKDVDGIIDRLKYESDLVQAREIAKTEAPERVKELDHMLRYADGKCDYKEIYEDESTHEKSSIETLMHVPRFQWVGEKVAEYGCKSILDFACHTGGASFAILNANGKDCKITGYDLSEKAVAIANEHKERIIGDELDVLFTSSIKGLDIEQEIGLVEYDALFNGEMLEHVLDPSAMVDELEGYVKDGGKMFITVPKGAWEWLSRQENLEKDIVFHINHFDGQDIQDMFGKKKDFKVQVLDQGAHGSYGEHLGNYLVEYTVDGTKTGARDLDRKRLTTRPHQSISLCMIGKDAEKTIEQTLDSLKDGSGNMIPDEMILVDDNSKKEPEMLISEMSKRAIKYGVSVKKNPKTICAPDYDGFANARNYSVKEAKGKWILWIDTDEITKGLAGSRKYLEGSLINAFVVKQFHPQRDNYIEADSPQRLYRATAGKFYGYIHEQAQADINNAIAPALILDDAEIWNMGSALEGERRHKAMERNLPLLDKDWNVNVLEKAKKGEVIRKLTPILVIRDLLNRMQQVYEQFRTYDTREVKENIMPQILQIYNKYCKDEKDGIYIAIADKIMQQIYGCLQLGHDVEMIIDGKKIKKRYVDLDDFIKDVKEI